MPKILLVGFGLDVPFSSRSRALPLPFSFRTRGVKLATSTATAVRVSEAVLFILDLMFVVLTAKSQYCCRCHDHIPIFYDRVLLPSPLLLSLLECNLHLFTRLASLPLLGASVLPNLANSLPSWDVVLLSHA